MCNTHQLAISSPAEFTTVDLSGTPIAEVPMWSGNFSYMHTWRGVWRGQLTGEVDMWDLSLQYQPDSASWSMRVYVDNLTTKLVYTAESVNNTHSGLGGIVLPAARRRGDALSKILICGSADALESDLHERSPLVVRDAPDIPSPAKPTHGLQRRSYPA